MKATDGSPSIVGRFVALGLAIATGLVASPAGATDVRACVAFSEALSIGDDPANCVPENRVEAVSVKLSLTGGGATAQPGPLVLVKRLDQTSPTIFLDAARGRALPNVLVVIFESGVSTDGSTAPLLGRRLFSILLEDVVISALEDSAQDGSAGRLSPLEVVSFTYVRLRLRDDITGATGCFDFQRRMAC